MSYPPEEEYRAYSSIPMGSLQIVIDTTARFARQREYSKRYIQRSIYPDMMRSRYYWDGN